LIAGCSGSVPRQACLRDAACLEAAVIQSPVAFSRSPALWLRETEKSSTRGGILTGQGVIRAKQLSGRQWQVADGVWQIAAFLRVRQDLAGLREDLKLKDFSPDISHAE
jgi:hypothetical protein